MPSELDYSRQPKRPVLWIPVALVVAVALVFSARRGCVALDRFGRSDRNYNRNEALTDISNFTTALEFFRKDNGRYPSTAEGLGSLLTPPANCDGWRGPYVMHVRNDGWGHPYVYRLRPDGRSFDIYSCGPDGINGTADDIRVDH